MNDHHHAQKNLALYISGDLDDKSKARITAHVAQCNECRSACQQHRTLLAMLSDEATAKARRPAPASWRRVVAAAAALLVFCAGYFTARQSEAHRYRPERESSQPHRVYDRYVASSSRGSGMFRALAAVARVEEPR